MRKILILFLPFLLISCVTNPFREFYSVSDGYYSGETESFLTANEKPEIYYSNDIYQDINELLSDYYLLIGISGYNGPERSDSVVRANIESLCKEKGAKLAIYSYEYTDTRNGTISLPDSSTTYFSGNGYGSSGSYWMSGSSRTTYMRETSYSIRRGDYSAAFFIPMTKEQRNSVGRGLTAADITPEARKFYKRNTGVLVGTVYKDTPAYYANIYPGDLIIAIDGIEVQNFNQAKEILKGREEPVITVIHDGMEYDRHVTNRR